MEDKIQQEKEYAAKRFNIPIEDVLFYNSGICYDRVGVLTKESADKVTKAVEGDSVNGGMLDGMPLGGQRKTPRKAGGEYFDVIC
jgi:hypothetical protein